MRDLLGGIVLLLFSIGLVIASYPRHGKTAAFVKKPFVGPLVSILIVTGFAIAFLMLAAYFTTIDDATLAGAKSL